jgi:eukaryotic-like serine/threonine-protein kinase
MLWELNLFLMQLGSEAAGFARYRVGGNINIYRFPRSLFAFIVAIIISGCGSGRIVGQFDSPTETNPPTVTSVAPTASPARSMPPTKAAFGDTWVSEADGMTMVYVPAGEFWMGNNSGDVDEKPYRNLSVPGFWIDQTEVTQGMYAQCTAGGCQPPTCANGGPDYPVVCVDWSNARDYCLWAGRRLPSETEWEKAARGTDGRIYPWGNEPATCEYAVMDDGAGNGCGKGNSAWAVGSKPKGISPYGALDMAGNVAEWVADWDPFAVNGAGRVLRGGGYFSIAGTVRAAKREVLHLPVDRFDGLGFRCAQS